MTVTDAQIYLYVVYINLYVIEHTPPLPAAVDLKVSNPEARLRKRV
jgi:hypothetical protein